ncbi:DUF4870 domain-containing protein [Candidatus Sumerlaeota bacterium]|nr:DUF4870 domain-containing protein [Candidatus Sumerlaeota bacterium]
MTTEPLPEPRRPLSMPPLTPDQRLVGAMAHLFAILPIWGLVVGFWIWHTRREEHPELRFHALQALLWQGIGLLITVVYAVAQLFFKLLGVLDEEYSETLCLLNTRIWEVMLIAMALLALWGAIHLRVTGRHDYPVLGPALRRELARLDAEERRRERE